jgi:hypothetical protein
MRRDVDEATAAAAAGAGGGGGGGGGSAAETSGGHGEDMNADARAGRENEDVLVGSEVHHASGGGGGGGGGGGDETTAAAAAAAAGARAADLMRSRCHDVGTAARIIQITRGDRPVRSYTLLLEGRCRFQLDRFAAVTPFIIAHVRQLDSLSHSSHSSHASHGGARGVRGGPRGGDVTVNNAADAELHEMAASFKELARGLVDKLEHRKGHARRLKSMLESAPAHRLADLFVAGLYKLNPAHP